MDLVSSISEELLHIEDLLEDYWFFQNLFTRKSRSRSSILRYCHSDPYPSSIKIEDLGFGKVLEASTRQDLVMEPPCEDGFLSEEIRAQESRSVGCFLHKKEPGFKSRKIDDLGFEKVLEGSEQRCLIRVPSLPPYVGRIEYETKKKMVSKLTRQFSENIRAQEPSRQSTCFLQKKERRLKSREIEDSGFGKILEGTGKCGLIRVPSLPPYVERNESETKKKLTRQFSEKVRVQEPRSFLQNKEAIYQVEKVVKEGSRRNKTGANNTLQRTQTMPSDLGREEDQESDSRMGFLIREALASSQNVLKKQEGSSSHKTLLKTLSSIETTTHKDIIQSLKGQAGPRPVATGFATRMVPPRVPRDPSKEMKDQIKFWARAVASNVRQEC